MARFLLKAADLVQAPVLAPVAFQVVVRAGAQAMGPGVAPAEEEKAAAKKENNHD
ncbi:MAG: hypothetical protein NUW07_07760 [Candidatus Saccharicenans sp.]|jgi:hypothetical protein|nr:hypothetical protein [Candidatus Saccharicenans sp.]